MAKQLRIVVRNLDPMFRHFLEGKSVGNFEDLGRLGAEYERRRELDHRYAPPPPKGKSRIPAAAFRREESVVGAASTGEEGERDANRHTSKTDRKNRKAESRSETSGSGGNTAVDVRVDTFIPANAPSREVQQQAHTWEDRPSSALLAAHTIPPKGVTNTQKGAVNRDDGGFKGRCFLCKNVGHKQSECSLPVCYACSQPGHYTSAYAQGRSVSATGRPSSAPSNNQTASRGALLADREVGTLGFVGEGAAAARSQQSTCSDYDRRERRDLLREIQVNLESESNVPVPHADRDTSMSTGGEISAEQASSAEYWLERARARLAALRSEKITRLCTLRLTQSAQHCERD